MKRLLAVVLLAVAGTAAAQALRIEASEPRAFGYQVGDLVQRHVVVQAAAGWRLDEASLPKPGGRGRSLELRRVVHRAQAEGGGNRHEIDLEYQVFLAPSAVRTVEIASFRLRFEGPGRAEEALVEAWPVTVAPLVPVEVSPRRGLGDWQPDAEPPQVDTRRYQSRLKVSALLATLLAAALAVAYLGPPWRAARNQPFGRAWRSLRQLSPNADDTAWRDACKQLHDALNRSAGEVVFESGLARFIGARPAFAPLRDDLARFLQLSSGQFFGGAPRDADDARWLVTLCRRCKAAERGLLA